MLQKNLLLLYLHLTKHLLISPIVISKEDAIFKTRSKPKENVQLRWISLFSKYSWIKTNASGVSYELGVNCEKKLLKTKILLIKMDIAHFTLVNLKI